MKSAALYSIVFAVANAVDCSVENILSSKETLLNYPYLVHCTSLNQHLVLGAVGLGLYLLILLYFLSSTADGFFCPCLQATVERFHISPNIAGITFLSFGNGSPDVFSNLAAFSTGTPKIGVAGILGGGLFVTTVVTAAVGLVSPDHQQQIIRPTFVRDVLFYLLAVLYLAYVFYFHQGRVAFVQALGFLGIYFTFVLVVFFQHGGQEAPEQRTKSHSIYSVIDEGEEEWDLSLMEQYPLLRASSAPIPSSSEPSSTRSKFSQRSVSAGEFRPTAIGSTIAQAGNFGPTARRWTRSYLDPYVPSNGPTESSVTSEDRLSDLYASFDLSTWDRIKLAIYRSARRCKRVIQYGYNVFYRFIWYPLEYVLTIARRLTVPLVDIDTWNQTFAILNPPCICAMILTSLFGYSWFSWTLWLSVLCLGSPFSVLVAWTTDPLIPPCGYQLVIYLVVAFVMSIIWIMSIANEVLCLLEALGELLSISHSILGISVLAWGNSIGDLVSNVTISKDGFPIMALAGCFAGPMFNLLIGVGLSLLVGTFGGGQVDMGHPSRLDLIGFVFLILSLVVNLSAAKQLRYSRSICITLLSLYLVFILVASLSQLLF